MECRKGMASGSIVCVIEPIFLYLTCNPFLYSYYRNLSSEYLLLSEVCMQYPDESNFPQSQVRT